MHSLLLNATRKFVDVIYGTFCNFRFDDDSIAVLNSDRYAIYVLQYEHAVSRKGRSSRENRDRDCLDWIIRQSGWLRGERLVTRWMMRGASCGRDPPANDKYTSRKKSGRDSAQKRRVSKNVRRSHRDISGSLVRLAAIA